MEVGFEPPDIWTCIALSHSYATLLAYDCDPVNAFFFFFLLFLYLYILMPFQALSRVSPNHLEKTEGVDVFSTPYIGWTDFTHLSDKVRYNSKTAKVTKEW